MIRWIRGERGLRGLATVCLVVVWCLPLTATAAISRDAEWQRPWFARVDIKFPGTDFHARYDFWRCSCGDVLIRSEETEPEKVTTGELLLLGGRTLLVKGFDSPEGNISGLLDSPMLMVQTLFALLNESERHGPWAIKGEQELRAEEKRRDLKLDTGLASGGFPAPWNVLGKAHLTEEGHVRYDLTFTFENRHEGVSAGQIDLKFSGVLDFNDEIFPYDGDLPLSGWTLQEISASDPVLSVPAEGLLEDLREIVRNRPKK
jgi:hypothetical protein